MFFLWQVDVCMTFICFFSCFCISLSRPPFLTRTYCAPNVHFVHFVVAIKCARLCGRKTEKNKTRKIAQRNVTITINAKRSWRPRMARRMADVADNEIPNCKQLYKRNGQTIRTLCSKTNARNLFSRIKTTATEKRNKMAAASKSWAKLN